MNKYFQYPLYAVAALLYLIGGIAFALLNSVMCFVFFIFVPIWVIYAEPCPKRQYWKKQKELWRNSQ
jgi:hypothetical protein